CRPALPGPGWPPGSAWRSRTSAWNSPPPSPHPPCWPGWRRPPPGSDWPCSRSAWSARATTATTRWRRPSPPWFSYRFANSLGMARHMIHLKPVLPRLSALAGSLLLAGCVTTTPPQDSDLFTHDPDLVPAPGAARALPLGPDDAPAQRKILRQPAPLPAGGAAPYRGRGSQDQDKVRL